MSTTSPRTTLDRLNGQHIAMMTADHDSALIQHADGDLEVVAPFDRQAQRDSDQVGASVLRHPACPWAEDLIGQARGELLAAGKPAPIGTARKDAAALARVELADEVHARDAAEALLEALPPLEPSSLDWDWLDEADYLEVQQLLAPAYAQPFCHWIPLALTA